jgi:hypothetical protein
MRRLVHGLDVLAALVARLERRMDFDLSVSERTLYVSMGEEPLTGTVEFRRLHSLRIWCAPPWCEARTSMTGRGGPPIDQ